MPEKPLHILYEDNHLLVVNKPAELPTMGVRQGDPSLVVLAKAYLKHKYHKPGNVFLGVVSRLDRMVTGAVVLARTSKAASRLSEQFRLGTVSKVYWAAIAGTPASDSGVFEDWVRKNDQRQRVESVRMSDPGAKQARLRYQTIKHRNGYTILEIDLMTGRKHQIRVQLAERSMPIVGDKKYGSQQPFARGIALHSRVLSFAHPVSKDRLRFEVETPASWTRFRLDEK